LVTSLPSGITGSGLAWARAATSAEMKNTTMVALTTDDGFAIVE
jgi:hypothetical protein